MNGRGDPANFDSRLAVRLPEGEVEAERREGPNGEVLYVDAVSLAALEAVREAVGMSGRPLMPVGASLPDIEDLPLEFAVLQTRFEMLEARVTRLENRMRSAPEAWVNLADRVARLEASGDKPL